MIPVKLWLRNFLSYGENTPTLDFRGFKMACLSGRNGHGKSALLDAMTWAVWGEARKPGHSRTPDADLVRLSTSNMAVEFTFWLNGQTYQVYREYQKSKRGNAKLEFRVKSPGEDQFSILTGNSKKEITVHLSTRPSYARAKPMNSPNNLPPTVKSSSATSWRWICMINF